MELQRHWDGTEITQSEMRLALERFEWSYDGSTRPGFTDRNREILRAVLVFGMSLKGQAVVYGLTRARVGRIVEIGLRRLRHLVSDQRKSIIG